MHDNRDDFTDKTKELMARRAGWRCSNPFCRALTCGAGEAADTAMNVGVAAHICAASPGGKRYDPGMTREIRRNVSNGIWLCQTCAKLVDSDAQRYTVQLLHDWKARAERETLLELERSRNKKQITETTFPERIRELAGAISSCNSYEAVMECLFRLQYEMDTLVGRLEELRDKVELAKRNGDMQWEQIYQTQFGHTLSLFEQLSSEARDMQQQAYYLRRSTEELSQNASDGYDRYNHCTSSVDIVFAKRAEYMLRWLKDRWNRVTALEEAVDEFFEARRRYEQMTPAMLEL